MSVDSSQQNAGASAVGGKMTEYGGGRFTSFL